MNIKHNFKLSSARKAFRPSVLTAFHTVCVVAKILNGIPKKNLIEQHRPQPMEEKISSV